MSESESDESIMALDFTLSESFSLISNLEGETELCPDLSRTKMMLTTVQFRCRHPVHHLGRVTKL